MLFVILAWAGCSTPKQPLPTPLITTTVATPYPVIQPFPVDVAPPPTVRTNSVPATNTVLPPVAPNPVVVSPIPVPQHPLPPATNAATKTHRDAATPEWVDLNQWCSQTGLGQLEIGRTQGHFTLQSKRGNLEFTAKSQSARWKGMMFLLGYAPQISHGKCYVHRLDLQNNVQPLVNYYNCDPGTNKVLVIDPGHGGEPGSRTIVGGRTEKQLTLDWALRTKALLAGHGWQVYLTRTNDVEVPLTNRVAFADKVHADLFISLHFNSIPNSDQSGLETYCTTPAGMPSHLVRGAEELYSQTNNAFDAENLGWALQVQHEIVTATHALDRGVRRARFLGVIRTQHRPALLIEGGYLSNRREASQIVTEAYRQKLAEGLARAILKK